MENLARELAAAEAGLVYRPQLTGEVLRVRGADAPAWLQATLSQDLAPLAAGSGARSLLLDARGAVLADLAVLREAEGFLLLADADPARPLAEELARRLFREQVELASLEANSDVLWLGGPAAPALLAAQLAPGELPAAPLAHRRSALAGWPLTLLASPRLGAPGFELVMDGACGPQGPETPTTGEGPAAALRGLFRALADAGGLRLSPAAAEHLRVAAGRARRDPDLLRVLPQEAGLVPEAVSLGKGCYPGQEVVMRQASRGRPRWRPLILAGPGAAPAPGTALQSPAGESEGWVSSTASAPAPPPGNEPGFLALGYLRTGAACEGLRLEDGRPLALRPPRLGPDSN
ncbi:hypothetical protein FJ251_09230 [bacterium]|nr:hypothetical protein [bacterium]